MRPLRESDAAARRDSAWSVSAARSLTRLPELNLLAFGFLLHLPWELWLFEIGMSRESHLQTSGELPLALSLAAFAHAATNVIAFWFIAAVAGTRGWIGVADRGTGPMFVLSSGIFTLIFESLVMGVLTQWEHPSFLPTFVAPGIELASVLQAVVTPVLLVAVLRRQLGSSPAK